MVTGVLPLRLEGAEVRRRGTRLLGPIDLDIAGAGTTIILGPNGAGKSTLLRAMHGLDRLREGRRVWGCSAAEAQTRQAFVFQTPIIMRRSVCASIAYALTVQGVPRAEATERAADWAGRVGLGHVLDRPARTLSAGERQKLALARALIRAPEIVFLDEPCANLDGCATREIEALLTEARGSGTRIVMATHDLGQARRLATEVVFLVRGQVCEAAPAPAFFDAPQTDKARAFLAGDIVE